MVNIEKVLKDQNLPLMQYPGSQWLINFLKVMVREDEINAFIDQNQHLQGFAFLDKVLEHFDFSYQVSNKSLNNIPAEGRVIIVANHPIGSLDGLALLKLVRTVRSDVRIVANDLLSQITPLKPLFLPVDVSSDPKTYKKCQIRAMHEVLKKEEALVIFPAGEVSRIRPNGVRDGQWRKGFIRLAKHTSTPILPIYIDAKNSLTFYSLSAIYKPFGTAMLSHEMFNKMKQNITFYIGNPVPVSELNASENSNLALAKRFRKHIYQLGKKKPKLQFNTIRTIAHPSHRRALKRELFESQLLGSTEDEKLIFLFDYKPDSPVMHEIGRLRELSFRSVEEGTGTSLDIDVYDSYYRHIILWDEKALEIVGAYRLGECQRIIESKGIEGLYINDLFEIKEPLTQKLTYSVELGRSFVQPRYWGKRGLDYLWYGIGAYLRQNPHIKYLIGPVSLSRSYPLPARELIISFYAQQFGTPDEIAKARVPFVLSDSAITRAQQLFAGEYKAAYTNLNASLSEYGVKVPTLYKQYAEICDKGGVHVYAFNIDKDFGECIDSLILIELNMLKQKKRDRYIGRDLEYVEQKLA